VEISFGFATIDILPSPTQLFLFFYKRIKETKLWEKVENVGWRSGKL